MISKILKLENLLDRLSAALGATENKRYVANQALRAENINLAEGATLNIQMNNTIYSVDIINQCREIVNELKPFFPGNEVGLDQTLNHYKNMLLQKALAECECKKKRAAVMLGISYRQIRYCIQKNPQLMAKNANLLEGGHDGRKNDGSQHWKSGRYCSKN